METNSATQKPARFETVMLIISVLFFAILRFGINENSPILIDLLSELIGYFVLIYIFYQLVKSSYNGRTKLVWILAGVVFIFSLVLSGFENGFKIFCEWSMIMPSGYLVGKYLRNGKDPLKTYITGLTIVLVFAVLFLYPDWQLMINEQGEVNQQMLVDMKKALPQLGYTDMEIAESTGMITIFFELFQRLIPAMTLLNPIMQFSLAFLIFGFVLFKRNLIQILKPYNQWKMPFEATSFLIIALLMRVLGNDIMTLVADNILLILFLYYCLTGLAFTEWALKKLKMPLFMKIIFYITLFLTQIFGFLAAVVIGFIDSFVDFRRRQKLSLEKK